MESLLQKKIEALGLDYVPVPEESIELIYHLFMNKLGEKTPSTDIEHFYFGVYHERISHNFPLMKHHYMIAINEGNSDAMYNLARYYEREEKNYVPMKVYYRMAINRGSIRSMVALGNYYQDIEVNESLMLSNYLLAIELKNQFAMNNLAYYYSTKDPEVEQNQELTIQYYQMAIQEDNAHSMKNLADYYRKIGGHTSLMKKYYHLSIQAGNKNSINKLGEYYLAQVGSEEAFEFGLAYQLKTLITKNYREEYVHRLLLLEDHYLAENQITDKHKYRIRLWKMLKDEPSYFSLPYCVKDVLEMIKAYV